MQGDLASSQQDLFAATFSRLIGSLDAIAFSMKSYIGNITNHILLTIIGQRNVSLGIACRRR